MSALIKPIIAITMGDPAGIGPELIVKVLADQSMFADCCPFVVGDSGVMRDINQMLKTRLRFERVDDLSKAQFSWPNVDVICPEGLRVESVPWGQVDAAMGEAGARCLREAFELAMDGRVQGVVSGPLNKEAFHLAGYDYVDELAFLADLTDSRETFIMGAMASLLTVAVAEHVPFRDIPDLVKKDRILRSIRQMHHVLKKAGHAAPKVAVAALNVHAGDGGLFGREEIDEIAPAIDAARAQGIDAQGPVPADIVFLRALQGDFDGVVYMYHDQANIARKLQPRQEGATIFVGLPVLCGTTAHGTAFDKAGQGIADPGSLEAAIRYVARLSRP